MEDKRSFTVVSVKRSATLGQKGEANRGGRFVSSTPAGAARKAVSQICRQSKIRGQCSMVVSIQETTRGSAGKVFTYRVRRVVKPTKVDHAGVTVTHKYETTVKAVNLTTLTASKKSSASSVASSLTGGYWF